ncbi:hypothetical protein LCGC14_0885630 [marine sediment metagenome]|uniref:Uncharacterized protein n=1 Tax=marine sediment metagenome TaxID=412755 RepID=A0A0F9NNL1_9ZZZZ
MTSKNFTNYDGTSVPPSMRNDILYRKVKQEIDEKMVYALVSLYKFWEGMYRKRLKRHMELKHSLIDINGE